MVSNGRINSGAQAGTAPAQVVTVTSDSLHIPINNSDPANPIIGFDEILDTTYAALTALLLAQSPPQAEEGYYKMTDRADLGIICFCNTLGSTIQPSLIDPGKIALAAQGGYLNADWSNAGSYQQVVIMGYNNLVGGPFILGETISDVTTGAFGTLKTDNGTTIMVVNSTGTFTAGNALLGGTSGATANVNGAPTFGSSLGMWQTTQGHFTYNTLVGTFQVGETVTGGTSGATGVVVSDTGVILTLNTIQTGFLNGEAITGGTSGATANTTSLTTYTFNPNFGKVTVWIDTISGRWSNFLKLNGNVTSTDPNVSADWMLLNRSQTNGYIESWDALEYDFVNDFIQKRTDHLGNTKEYKMGVPDTGEFLWGYSQWTGNKISWGTTFDVTDPSSTLLNLTAAEVCTIKFHGSGNTFGESQMGAAAQVKFQDGVSCSGSRSIFEADSVFTIQSTTTSFGDLKLGAKASLQTNGFNCTSSRIGQDWTITLVAALLDNTIDWNGSNVVLNLDMLANTVAGVLTIPANYSYAGKFHMTTAAAANVTKIKGAVPTAFNFSFDGANTIVNTFQPTPAPAGTDQISSDSGNAVITGRTNGSDIITFFRGSGTVNVKISQTVAI